MGYGGFYRYISKEKGKYVIRKNGEMYAICNTPAEALYERDRLINANWDWELYVEMPDTVNGYIHISLPPFEHKASYITHIKEYWTVVSKGANPKYYGCYHTKEEAERVRLMYNGRICHRNEVWRVRKKIDGKIKTFGNFKTREEAEKKVRELENGWDE